MVKEDIIFSISQENRKGELFMLVNARYKGSSRLVYGTDLPKNLREVLLGRGGSLDTLSCEKISLNQEKGFIALQELLRSRLLEWKGRALFYNPLGKSSIELSARHTPSGGVFLTGSLLVDGEQYHPSDVEFLFLGTPIWGIVKQRVFCLHEKTRPAWIRGFAPEGVELSKKDKEWFAQEASDPREGFPKVLWVGEETTAASVDPFPKLLLRDAYGAFADLYMEYPDLLVDFSSTDKAFERNMLSEKAWEKDLLETGFVRKRVGETNYYCPMDRVSKTLSFLLELGWSIVDHRGRRVCKLVDKQFTATKSGPKQLFLKGEFSYGEHKASLSDVLGAFTRQDNFVELSSDSVGWLGEESLIQEIGDLVEAEQVGEGCFLRHAQLGLFENSRSLKPLLERYAGAKQEAPPCSSLFRGTLYPYQEEGRKWLHYLANHEFSGLLADEMGLGKTVQVLSFLANATVDKPVLIVAPTSLLFNWKKEWETFLDHKKLYIHEGSKRGGADVLSRQEAVLTSYALLRIDQLLLSQVSWSLVVLDEAQWIKNPESQVAKAAFSLQTERRLCLTGTPVENRADDLWSLFHFLEPELLGERKEFLAQLEGSHYKQRIRKKISPFLLRRRKEDVAKDLPQKFEQTVFVDMKESQREFYEMWLAKTRKGLITKVQLEGAKAHRMEIFEAILRLRQICVDPVLVDGEWAQRQEDPSAKVERILEDLEEVSQLGRKVLLYSQFTTFLRFLEKKIQKLGISYVYLDGNTKDREQVVERFQQDKSVSVFLLSLKAGGVGLNLTAADYVFLCDPWWNESVEKQAIDRAHRLGRKETIVARRYIVAESIEEKLLKIKAHKSALAEGLLEGSLGDGTISAEEMWSLLTSL